MMLLRLDLYLEQFKLQNIKQQPPYNKNEQTDKMILQHSQPSMVADN